MKYLILAALLGFLGWLVQRYVRQKLRQARGQPVPVQKGPRSITVLAVAIVLVYGGYIAWRLIEA